MPMTHLSTLFSADRSAAPTQLIVEHIVRAALPHLRIMSSRLSTDQAPCQNTAYPEHPQLHTELHSLGRGSSKGKAACTPVARWL